MCKTKLTLVSNNIYYGLGLQSHINNYELETISFKEFKNKSVANSLSDVNLVIIRAEQASPEEIIDLVKSTLEKRILVIYLAQNKDNLALQLCSLGCQGIIEEDYTQEQLSTAIKALYSGGVYYSQGILENSYLVLLGPLVELFEELDLTTQKLTPKEKEIAQSYLDGLSLTKIMEKLDISKSTINNHMESIRNKFEVSSNREIIIKYQIGRLKSINV